MMNYVSINGGVLMPQIGYGIYQFSKDMNGNGETQRMKVAAADERRRTMVAANSKKPRRARAAAC